jgi:hypothetical protein
VSGKDSLAFGLYGSTITVEATLPSGQVKRYEISTSATVDQLRKKIWICKSIPYALIQFFSFSFRLIESHLSFATSPW